MDGEQRRQDVHAAGDGSVAGGDSTVNNDCPPDSEQMPPKGWSRNQKLALATVVATIAAAVITPLLTIGGNGGSGSTGQSQVQNNGGSSGAEQGQGEVNGNNYGQAGGIINNNNYGSTASSNPHAQIVQQTGQFNDEGFTTAIFDRDDSIVALYLKSGMTAATLYQGTSAILFGFEEVNQNDGPIQSGGAVALIKTFQAAGFKVNEDLQDSSLMGQLTGGLFPAEFDTPLTPKGYTGGYQDGTFVGSLLFWIVQRTLGWGPTTEDIQVIHYLVSQGADCNVPLSFLKYAISTGQISADEVQEQLPIMQSCAT